MEIAFYGAAGEVTGSCYLVSANGKRVLIDCGMFQGGDDHQQESYTAFPFSSADIDAVLLTHAHLDHCGRLPMLARQGFRGTILATDATRELAQLVLLDSARLQDEEAKYLERKQLRQGKTSVAPLPLYDELDVFDSMKLFGPPVAYDQPIEICDGIRATFGNASHILGSAWILLEVTEQSAVKRMLFSGDLGTGNSVILNALAPAPQADYVIMESTYGDRLHKPLGPSVEELRVAVHDTLDRGGNVIIPTFALERAQEILFFLHSMIQHGELPRNLAVFLDSPMAISATKIFAHHQGDLHADIQAMYAAGDDPFGVPEIHFTRDTAESIAINQIKSGAVILAGSGMANGGRVLHHLKHNLWRQESSVVFVGYAATGTLGRRIIDGQKDVRIFGEEIHVAAHIYTIGGFSAHADQQGLLAWHRSSGMPQRTFLIHGEDDARKALASQLQAQGHTVELPTMQARYEL
jgi:metallo-beta-lactamase family protein